MHGLHQRDNEQGAASITTHVTVQLMGVRTLQVQSTPAAT